MNTTDTDYLCRKCQNMNYVGRWYDPRIRRVSSAITSLSQRMRFSCHPHHLIDYCRQYQHRNLHGYWALELMAFTQNLKFENHKQSRLSTSNIHSFVTGYDGCLEGWMNSKYQDVLGEPEFLVTISGHAGQKGLPNTDFGVPNQLLIRSYTHTQLGFVKYIMFIPPSTESHCYY